MASTTHPDGHGKEFENVRRGIERWMRDHPGIVPTRPELEASGHGWIVKAAQRHHGGLVAVRGKMQIEGGVKPTGFADDFENVRAAIDEWMAGHDGAFPNMRELNEADLCWLSNAIVKQHGGFRAVRKRMSVEGGMKSSEDVRDFETIRPELERWMRDHDGAFPTREELVDAGLGWVDAAIWRYHGGGNAVRERLGSAAGRKAPGYWDDFENVRRETERWMALHDGAFPSYKALWKSSSSSLGAAIQQHGGFPAVRRRMGLTPVSDAELHEHGDLLISVVTALGLADTMGFWARIRDRWTDRQLRAAASAFHESGSLDAFRALADG